MVEEMKPVEDVFEAEEPAPLAQDDSPAAAAAVPVPESAPASEEANPDDNLDQGIGEIHQQMNAEFVPSEPSVPASAPASSTTTPETSEEDAEDAAAGNGMDINPLDADIGQNQIEIELHSLPSETPEDEDALEDDTEEAAERVAARAAE